MNGMTPTHFELASRANARALAQEGVACLAMAFNHLERADVAHRYSDAVQSRFRELATELVRLVELGEIEANPAHALHLKVRAAHGDEALQAVIRRVSRKTPVKGR
ncbi:hypothetical protein ACFQNJ_03565 [Hydrogenophaga bisanensis]|uniref:Uncharacterized protein n=1 Tax=Hydrogenophaga bisanensis TaxID=439611 RepID=A0ABW2R5E5_9BURK